MMEKDYTIEQIMQEVAGIAFDHGPDGPRVGDRLRALELLSDWLENGSGAVEPVEILDDLDRLAPTT